MELENLKTRQNQNILADDKEEILQGSSLSEETLARGMAHIIFNT